MIKYINIHYNNFVLYILVFVYLIILKYKNKYIEFYFIIKQILG